MPGRLLIKEKWLSYWAFVLRAFEARQAKLSEDSIFLLQCSFYAGAMATLETLGRQLPVNLEVSEVEVSVLADVLADLIAELDGFRARLEQDHLNLGGGPLQ
jgi:hypothetical protein